MSRRRNTRKRTYSSSDARDLNPRTLEEYQALLKYRSQHPETYMERLALQQGYGTLAETANSLMQPQVNLRGIPSEEALRNALKLPVSLGTTVAERERMDANFFASFDHAGGIGMLHQDLLSHSANLGQTPVSSFLGYGALQNIAQNGMIKACVQTVADDCTKKWIEISGGKDAEEQELGQEQKQALRLDEDGAELDALLDDSDTTTQDALPDDDSILDLEQEPDVDPDAGLEQLEDLVEIEEEHEPDIDGDGTSDPVRTKPKKTPAEQLDELQKSTYNLQQVFHKAIALVGYYGGAFIFIDTGAPYDKLALPLAINDKSAELCTENASVRFVVIDPVNVTPAEYNSDNPLRPDYMRPVAWWVLGHKVHASRLLVLYDNEPPLLLKPAYNFLGVPRAQILWDYIVHWNEARIYANDLLKKVSLLVVKTNTDQIFNTPDGVRMFDIRMSALQRYRDNNSVYVCDKEQEDVNNVQTTITGATDVVRQSLEMIAAINRTPAVKLLGISPSGFNATGESDITNYYDHIQSQQELYRPHIQRCLDAIQLVHFGKIDPSIKFEFVELASENESTKAATASAKMQLLSMALQAQAISSDEMRQAIKQDPDMGLDFLTGDAPDIEPQDMSEVDDEDQATANALFGLGADKQDSPTPPQPPLDDASKYQQAPEPASLRNDAEVKDA